MLKVKDKERLLKAAGEKHLVTYKGAPVTLSGDFSTKIFQARKDLEELFTVMKSKDQKPRLLYSEKKLSFRIKGYIKSFSDKKKKK